MQDVPHPCLEKNDPNKFWGQDEFDKYIPKTKGLISDMIYHTRGMEIPTAFTIWGTLFALSTIVKREAWVEWTADSKLYPNLFVILAGPAGIVKKGSIIFLIQKILSGMQDKIDNEQVRKMKKLVLIANKATPESVLDAMLPHKTGREEFEFQRPDGSTVLDNHGNPKRYKITSEAALILPEMSVMLNRQQYNESMIQNLLDLYDPQDTWEWRTKGDGVQRLRRTYMTMIAGTTTEGFKSSIPQAAFGDGFLSRCVTMYQPGTKREFPVPLIPKGAPSVDELTAKAGWIASTTFGEYNLSQEASDIYVSWYKRHKRELKQGGSTGIKSRIPVHLLKVAMLIEAQDYAYTEPVIRAQALQDAIRLIDATYQYSPILVDEIEEDEYFIWVRRIANYIQRHSGVNRRKVLQSTRAKAVDLGYCIDQLRQEGKIKIKSPTGKERYKPTKDSDETYHWVTGSDEEEEENE